MSLIIGMFTVIDIVIGIMILLSVWELMKR